MQLRRGGGCGAGDTAARGVRERPEGRLRKVGRFRVPGSRPPAPGLGPAAARPPRELAQRSPRLGPAPATVAFLKGQVLRIKGSWPMLRAGAGPSSSSSNGRKRPGFRTIAARPDRRQRSRPPRTRGPCTRNSWSRRPAHRPAPHSLGARAQSLNSRESWFPRPYGSFQVTTVLWVGASVLLRSIFFFFFFGETIQLKISRTLFGFGLHDPGSF